MQIDLSTPEKTLHALEHAYRSKDLEAAAACRNFRHEAQIMVMHLEKSHPEAKLNDDATLDQLAEVLDVKWREAGLPNFDGVTSRVVAIEPYKEHFYIVTEEGRDASGAPFSQRMFMSLTEERWAVLCPAAIYDRPVTVDKPWWRFW